MSPPSAPLGAVAASWLLEACSAATWTADELRALEVAAQSLDRAEKCREQIETEGQTTTNSRGAIVGHPLLSFEATNRASWLKAVRELGLIGGSDVDTTASAETRLSLVRQANASYGARHQRGQS